MTGRAVFACDALAAGGLWLITLGGSWYYLLAGAGMLASGVLLFLQRLSGVWLYWLVFIGTLIWALWEVGLDPWALLPRVLALAVIALLRAHAFGHPGAAEASLKDMLERSRFAKGKTVAIRLDPPPEGGGATVQACAWGIRYLLTKMDFT